jgi:DNA-binding NarL/FixJ family response regulator
MTNTRVIKIVIVDDHEMVRRGLAISLQSFDDMALVGEAGNALEALEICEELRPDVVLMDIFLPGMDGVAATAALRAKFPDTSVIAITNFPEPLLASAVLAAGAVGLLGKNISIDDLAAAIRGAVETDEMVGGT